MKLDALPALYGDCLLLTVSSDKGDVRMLIDGGPKTVYETTLKPFLMTLRKGLDKGTPLMLDAVMVSHIDEDHIFGILQLFNELGDLQDKKAPAPWRPHWLLYNSFDDLVGENAGGTAKVLGGETVLASLGSGALLFDGGQPSEDTLKILESYPQGNQLSNAAVKVKVTRNPPDQKPLMLTKPARKLRLGHAEMTVIGPRESEVKVLRERWNEWKAKKKPGATIPGFSAKLDNTVTNLSSIVVYVKEGTKTMLLCGDAQGDLIVEGLRDAKLLDKNGVLKVDVLKVPHHGSVRNFSPALAKAVIAKHYVFSANGSYANPDRGTLDLLEATRPEGGYSVHLTYAATACDDKHAADLQKEGKTLNRQKDGIAVVINRWRKEKLIDVAEGAVSLTLK